MASWSDAMLANGVDGRSFGLATWATLYHSASCETETAAQVSYSNCLQPGGTRPSGLSCNKSGAAGTGARDGPDAASNLRKKRTSAVQEQTPPASDKLAFNGSTATAKKVMAVCAETLTPIVVEGGGKDALIVDAIPGPDLSGGPKAKCGRRPSCGRQGLSGSI